MVPSTHAMSFGWVVVAHSKGTFMRMARNSSSGELLDRSLREKWRELKFLRYTDKDILGAIQVAKNKFPEYDWRHGYGSGGEE